MSIPGTQVRYSKWTNVLDIYDDGYNSAIWGSYDGNLNRCLGVRYNGEGQSKGFPNIEGFPLWYVEPDFLTRPILLEFLTLINTDPKRGNLINLTIALNEIAAR